MPLPLDVQFAQEKMLQAEGALRAYAAGNERDHSKHQELIEALHTAINEYVDAVASLGSR